MALVGKGFNCAVLIHESPISEIQPISVNIV